MVMEKIALAVCALLAFLLPIGFYCLVLASINRRSKPLLVGGIWDTIGLLFAMSGFFLITMPMLLSEFGARAFSLETGTFDAWVQYWILYLAYLLMVICGSAFIILWRGRKTLIYNVDADRFPKALERTLASLGLMARLDKTRLILTPAARMESAENTAFSETLSNSAPAANDQRHAELEIESFASLCHVTLHWEKITPDVRAQIEKELSKNLESFAPLENAAAGWFLNISGMIFGTLIMIVLTFVALIMLLRR